MHLLVHNSPSKERFSTNVEMRINVNMEKAWINQCRCHWKDKACSIIAMISACALSGISITGTITCLIRVSVCYII